MYSSLTQWQKITKIVDNGNKWHPQTILKRNILNQPENQCPNVITNFQSKI